MTARQIKAMMILQGVRQVDIAARLGVSQTIVHQVVYGRAVSRRIREEIARTLGVDVEEIWPSKTA